MRSDISIPGQLALGGSSSALGWTMQVVGELSRPLG